MKRILFLGGPVFQIPVVQKAKQMGLYVGVVDIDSDAPAFEYADEVFHCSIRDRNSVLNIALDFKANGIICGACDTGVLTAAYVCEALNLPGNTIEMALKATDKYEMLKAFHASGLPHPKFQFIEKEKTADFCLELPFPVISKPVDSSGSRGIMKINCQEQLDSSLLYSANASVSCGVLVEEFMIGQEVSVEMVVVDSQPFVLQITDKITSGAPHFYEMGHAQPSSLSHDAKTAITDLATKAVQSVGLKDSVAHVEIMLTDDGPMLIELGARLGGDCITTYLMDQSVSGLEMTEIAILIALGEHPDVTHNHNSGVCAAVRFIPPCVGVGLVKEVVGQDVANAIPGVIKTEVWCYPGERCNSSFSNSERLGCVIAIGNTTSEALDICQKGIDTIQINYYGI